MSEPVFIEPSSIDGASSGFRDQSDTLAEATGDKRGRLGAIQDMCGGDGPGNAFASRYRPHADGMLQAAEQLARGLGDIAMRLTELSQDVRQADRDAGVKET